MKTILFISIIILSINSLLAQSRVCYTYDNAGNRLTQSTICFKSYLSTQDSISILKPIIAKLDEMNITLYPNPTKGQLTVQITNKTCETEGELDLYDLNGRLIIQQKTLCESNMLDISGHPLGIYLMRIKACDKISEWKIIKE